MIISVMKARTFKIDGFKGGCWLVPAFFLFDAEGKLYFRAAGDKGYANVEPKIKQLDIE